MMLPSITSHLKNKKWKDQVYLFEVQEFLNDQQFIPDQHRRSSHDILCKSEWIKEAQAPWGQMDASDAESWGF